MVQFGQIFGVFRLLEEDNDLPMTQALDIPETPVQKKHVSKLNSVHATTIPESPDISDRVKKFNFHKFSFFNFNMFLIINFW